jgi:monoamine oxidase
MEEIPKSADVIIVGAGLAGLVAAESLKSRDANLNVLVLEAASRVGGRTCGQDVKIANDPPEEIDGGGEWILVSNIRLLQLIDRLGLQTYAPVPQEGLSLKVNSNSV